MKVKVSRDYGNSKVKTMYFRSHLDPFKLKMYVDDYKSVLSLSKTIKNNATYFSYSLEDISSNALFDNQYQ